MIVCPTCAKQNQDHYKFCLGCGAKLPAPPPLVAPAPPAAPAFSGQQMAASPPYTQAAPIVPVAPVVPPMPGYPAAPTGAVMHAPAAAQMAGPAAHVPVPAATSGAAAASIVCGSCQQVNPAGFAFCGRCGGSLARPAAPMAAPAGARADDMGSARTVFMDASAPAVAPAPSPAPAPVVVVHQARLVLLREDGSEGGVLVLEGGPECIGRNYGPPFDSDAYLDPDQAALLVTKDGIEIDDRRSLNGIFMKLVDKIELLDRDQFRVGQELLRYQDVPEPTTVDDETLRMGSPNPGFWGRIEVLASPDRAVAAVPIEGETFTIGRENGDLTFPHDGYVSGTHCRVVGDDSGVYLVDLGSSNGTYVRVRPGQLVPHGRMILVGQQLFRVEAG